MAKKHFFYSREAQVKKLDETGKPQLLTVEVTQEDGTVVKEFVPGKFEMETVLLEDHFNLDKVIRTHMMSKDEVIVLLDDGHEVTEKVPVLKNPNKKGPISKGDVIEEKQRIWVQSEIVLKGADVEAYYAALREIDAQL